MKLSPPSIFNIDSLIIPSKLENTNLEGRIDSSLTTYDRIFVRSRKEYFEQHEKHFSKFRHDPYSTPTDFAIFLGASVDKKSGQASTLLRSKSDHHIAYYDSVDLLGIVDTDTFKTKPLAIPISMKWDAKYVEENFLSLHSLNYKCNFDTRVYPQFDNTTQHFMVFGEFPQSWAGEKHDIKFEKELRKGLLTKIDKQWSFPFFKGKIEEYMIDTQPYIRVEVPNPGEKIILQGKEHKLKKYMWFRILPIKWHITNYDDLHFPLNRSGLPSKKKDFMLLTTARPLLGGIELNAAEWSSNAHNIDHHVRNYLNGYTFTKNNEYETNNFFRQAFYIDAPTLGLNHSQAQEKLKNEYLRREERLSQSNYQIKKVSSIEDKSKQSISSQDASEMLESQSNQKQFLYNKTTNETSTYELNKEIDKTIKKHKASSKKVSKTIEEDEVTKEQDDMHQNTTQELVEDTLKNFPTIITNILNKQNQQQNNNSQGEAMATETTTQEDYSNLANIISVNEDTLSIQEQIEFYVKNGISFMLHGLSGIGKSSRVRSIDPDSFVCVGAGLLIFALVLDLIKEFKAKKAEEEKGNANTED